MLIFFCFETPLAECLLNLADISLSMISPVKNYDYCLICIRWNCHKAKITLWYYRFKSNYVICLIANLEASQANVIILQHCCDLTETIANSKRKEKPTKKKLSLVVV